MPESNDMQPVTAQPYSQPVTRAVVRDFRPRGFKWVKAAHAIADGATNAEAAAAAGVTVSAVAHWRQHPKFIVLLGRYQERMEREAVAAGIALKSARLRKLNRQAGKMERLMEARAVALKDSVPGGDTGLLSHDQKGVGAGDAATVVDVYEFDAALDRAYRATLEQAAKEMGGQFDDVEPGRNNNGVAITINFPVMSDADREAAANAPIIDLPPMARRLLTRPSDGAQR